MSRAQTLVIALLVLHVLLGGLSLVIGRGEHKSPALRWWGWGLLMYAGGLLVTVAGMVIPRGIALTLGNSLITAAPVLCALGVLSHTCLRLNLRWVTAGVATTIVALAINNFGDYHRALGNLALPSIMAVAMFLLGAWAIVHGGPRDARVANQFLRADGDGRGGHAGAIPDRRVPHASGALPRGALRLAHGPAQPARDPHAFCRGGVARVAPRPELRPGDLRPRLLQAGERPLRPCGGCEVLKAAAQAFAEAKRGEEFLVLFSSQQSIEGAVEAAERLREGVARIRLRAGGDEVRLTVSGGVALYPDDGAVWDTLFKAADVRLYRAKAAGRDRVIGTNVEAIQGAK